MLVESTPCWASSAPASLLRACDPGSGGPGPTHGRRASRATYAAFVAYLAQRYGTSWPRSKSGTSPIRPTNATSPGPKSRSATPRCCAPPTPRSSRSTPMSGARRLARRVQRRVPARPLRRRHQGLLRRPGRSLLHLTLASLRAIHEVQLANGDNKPLWLDEFGWTSCWPQQKIQEEQACVTPQVQAANLTNIFRALARTPYVAAAIVYKLQDSATKTSACSATPASASRRSPRSRSVLASPLGHAQPRHAAPAPSRRRR